MKGISRFFSRVARKKSADPPDTADDPGDGRSSSSNIADDLVASALKPESVAKKHKARRTRGHERDSDHTEHAEDRSGSMQLRASPRSASSSSSSSTASSLASTASNLAADLPSSTRASPRSSSLVSSSSSSSSIESLFPPPSPAQKKHRQSARAASMSPRRAAAVASVAHSGLFARPSIAHDPLHGLQNSPELNIACVQNCVIRIDPRQHIRGSWLLEPCPVGQCYHDVELMIMPDATRDAKSVSRDRALWRLFERQSGAAICCVLQALGAATETVLRGHFATSVVRCVEAQRRHSQHVGDDSSFDVLREVQLHYVTDKTAGWIACEPAGADSARAHAPASGAAVSKRSYFRIKRSKSQSSL